MDLRECYRMMDADYDSVLCRLGSEQMVCRFLKKCVEKDELNKLQAAIGDERWQDAFLHAHNMKGYGLNLSLTAFTESSSRLCEALRGGEPKGDIAGMLLDVRADYEKLESAVLSLDPE